MKLNFDPTAEDYQGRDFNRSTIPSGRYLVCMTEAIEKLTKKGDGTCVHMKFKVIDGTMEGAEVMTFPIVDHRTDKTLVLRGQKQIANICRAVGKARAKDTEELFDIPLWIDVSVDGDYNRIEAYYTEAEGKDAAAPASVPRKSAPVSADEVPF